MLELLQIGSFAFWSMSAPAYSVGASPNDVTYFTGGIPTWRNLGLKNMELALCRLLGGWSDG